MLFRNLTSATLLALVASVAAENVRFTKASRSQLGLLRRDAPDPGYEPEVTACGDGSTCSEACGSGYKDCKSNDNSNHCYNPGAGESCCEFSGVGSSCERSYFCAHDTGKNTICCAVGKTLEECAKVNDVSPGSLSSDPPSPASTSSASSTAGAAKSSSTGRPGSNSTDSSPTKATSTAAPKETNGGNVNSGSAAALVLAAGVIAAFV